MNLRGAWALIKYTWTSWLQERGFFFLLAFGWMMPSLVYLFVWSTAAGEQAVGGISRDMFIVYYLVLICVNQLTYPNSNWMVGDYIREGLMNTVLLRPMSPFFDAVASDIAGKVVAMVFVVPIVTVLWLILRPEFHLMAAPLGPFVISVMLAWALRFFWGYWLALLTFWATRADSLLALQDAMIFLLAGQAAPVGLLPGVIGRVAQVLPFRHMVGFPVEVLTGQLSASEVRAGLVYQVAWLVVAMVLYRVIWAIGVRRYSAVGG